MNRVFSKRALALSLLLCLAWMVSACQAQPTPETDTDSGSTTYPLTLTDRMGRSVTLEKKPERVASLSPSNTEILYAIGGGSLMVGVDEVSNYPPEVAEVPKIGDYSGPNIEAVLGVRPDLVLCSTTLQAEAITQMENAGLTVLAVEASAYAEIVPSIQLVAEAVGLDAESVVKKITDAEQQVREATKDLEAPSVYFSMSHGEYGYWTAGAGSFIDDMITLAKGTNVSREGGAPWMEWSVEKIIADNPQIVLVSGDESVAESFRSEPALSALDAVTQGKVYALDADITLRPGPRIAEGLLQVAKILHPEAF